MIGDGNTIDRWRDLELYDASDVQGRTVPAAAPSRRPSGWSGPQRSLTPSDAAAINRLPSFSQVSNR